MASFVYRLRSQTLNLQEFQGMLRDLNEIFYAARKVIFDLRGPERKELQDKQERLLL